MKINQFSLLGAMLEVNILRKVLDYSSTENRVYIPYVCWVCKWNVLWVSQKASGCAFEKLITQIFLKCRTYFSSCPFSNCAKLKLTKYPVTVFFYHFWPGPSFLVILIHFFKKLFSLRRQNAAHEYNSYN